MSGNRAGSQNPTLRLAPRPSDINSNGHIFGGWVLAQMDIAGGIVARAEAQGPVATVAIEQMAFVAPILLGDVVSVYAQVARRGRTSVSVTIDVYASRPGGEIKVTEGLFTFVALDEDARPRPLPAATAASRGAP